MLLGDKPQVIWIDACSVATDVIDEGALRDLYAEGLERVPVRERLVELFGLIGSEDPRVTAARNRLSSLLF